MWLVAHLLIVTQSSTSELNAAGHCCYCCDIALCADCRSYSKALTSVTIYWTISFSRESLEQINLSRPTEVKMADDYRGLKMTEDKFINILLLGETGVGKSTLINSIANYLQSRTFQDVEREELLVLIPSTINVMDKNNKKLSIQIGSADKNEHQEVGVSGTQNVKTYVFPIGNGRTKVRLIDSPGMGDTRGVKKDDENCENILRHLAELDELHAICFLMRPTNTKITVLFEYCVKQILARLERSASDNIIFAFTNTRGTNYEPGETYSCLEKVIQKIAAQPPFVKIPFGDNLFCFDNEGFRCLAALKQGAQLTDYAKSKSQESWEYSSKECWRMIAYIIGDDNQQPLKPHQIKDSLSINAARNMIVQLAKPMTDITELISDEMRILQKHQESLAMDNQSLDDLKEKLYVPVVNLRVIDLPRPVTVCTHPRCAEMYKIGSVTKWNYKQKCNDSYESKSKKGFSFKMEVFSLFKVSFGSNDEEQGNCKTCGCDYSVHMPISYETETFDDTILDDQVQENIDTKDAAIEAAKKIINDINVKKDELVDEQSTIVQAIAQFAHFLQSNAIVPFNDAYKMYVKHLIEREQSLGRAADESVIANLDRMLEHYEKEKALFDDCPLDASSSPVDVTTVFNCIKKLFKLKWNGKKMKEIYDKQQACKKAEFLENCEYVHPKTAPRREAQ